MIDYLEFRTELTKLINRHSMENGSDTPDYILANYLTACLVAYDNALNERSARFSRGVGDVIPYVTVKGINYVELDVLTNYINDRSK
jgi:hypothetical protein